MFLAGGPCQAHKWDGQSRRAGSHANRATPGMRVTCESIPTSRDGLEVRLRGEAFHLPHDVVLTVCGHVKEWEAKYRRRSHARSVCKGLVLAFMDCDMQWTSSTMRERWEEAITDMGINRGSRGFADVEPIIGIIPCSIHQLPALACYPCGRAGNAMEYEGVVGTHFLECQGHLEVLREIMWRVFEGAHVHPEYRNRETGETLVRMWWQGSSREVSCFPRIMS